LQHGISKLSPDDGSVCLNYDAMRAAVVNDGLLLTVRVELVDTRIIVTVYTSMLMRRGTYLYLIHGGQFESCFGNFFQVFNIAEDFA
jgi:hypothetical protein